MQANVERLTRDALREVLRALERARQGFRWQGLCGRGGGSSMTVESLIPAVTPQGADHHWTSRKPNQADRTA